MTRALQTHASVLLTTRPDTRCRESSRESGRSAALPRCVLATTFSTISQMKTLPTESVKKFIQPVNLSLQFYLGVLVPSFRRPLDPEVDLLRPCLVIRPKPRGEARHQRSHYPHPQVISLLADHCRSLQVIVITLLVVSHAAQTFLVLFGSVAGEARQ